jgi:pimeloyl-ACP methyl ester carboxylesterase
MDLRVKENAFAAEMKSRIGSAIFEEHRIPSDTEGIELYIRNKRPATLTEYQPEKTIVIVHGATYSSGSLYDVPVGGYSFLDYLAGAGFDVFAVDVRGYGQSTRPREMEIDGSLNRPLVDTERGVGDFTTAIEFVLRHRGLDKAHLFAMSWGGTVAGAFAARNRSKVVKLALLAPQWVSDKPISVDMGGPLHCYRLVPVRESIARWLNGVPESARERLIPAGWFDSWAAATLAEDPWSVSKAPGKLRATNGPIQDIRDYWRAGRPFYEPSDIASPVLLLHGEWDRDVPLDVAQNYFAQLRNTPYRRWVEIGEATHMMLMEKNRLQVFKAITDFFLESFTPEQ